jgi:D-glucuronyl C5-epimerase C-terminus
MFRNLLEWGAVALATVGHHDPNIISYGALPQRIAVYDHVIEAKSMDYWNGPLTLDPNSLEYVRGKQRFRNPSNYGLAALPVGLPEWRNRLLHLDTRCNQPTPLTDRQSLGLKMIAQDAELLPNGAMTWRYDFALNYLNMVFQPGFNSAFSQAVNIAALLFAECKTNNRAYLDLANRAALGLITPIADGGLLNEEDGMTFFEELPAPIGLSPHILNADILSINVLFAMAARTGDERFKDLADRGADTLLKLAPQYDAPKCIKYDLKQNNGCHPDYVAYEAVLFEDLARWTGDDRFKWLSERWTSRVSK